MSFSNDPYSIASAAAPRRYKITGYNQRMAARVARRARLNEKAVAVAFTFNNLATLVIFSLVEDVLRYIPMVGAALEVATSILGFYFHRIVLVTDENVYVYRDLPFHIPGRLLASFRRGPGVVQMGSNSPSGFSRFIRRGQLTFQGGTVVYHGVLWIGRARGVVQEANIPAGH